jgi:hypothetical protein
MAWSTSEEAGRLVMKMYRTPMASSIRYWEHSFAAKIQVEEGKVGPDGPAVSRGMTARRHQLDRSVHTRPAYVPHP